MAHGARLSIAAVAERGLIASADAASRDETGDERGGLFFSTIIAPSFSSYFKFRFREGGNKIKSNYVSNKGFWVDRRSKDFDEHCEAGHGNGNRGRS